MVSFEGVGSVASLVCPGSVDRLLNELREVSISFPMPTVGGQEVTKSECAPVSGSMFSIGTSTVSCSASVAADLVEGCTFEVRVASRRLTVTNFVAFGDSITSGTVSLAAAMPTLAGIAVSYPAQLQDMLRERYPEQDLTIVNAGRGGEDAGEGRVRLPGVLDVFGPEVLLLLEGINRLELIGVEKVASDLEAMVTSGVSRGATVLLATLTPVGDVKAADRPGVQEAVEDLNERIRQIAQDYSLGPVVDLFAVFEQAPSLIGRDGLHPTADGYRVMADEFMKAIMSRWEETEGPVLSLSR